MSFLTAYWRKLLMANYEVPAEVLEPFVPWGTELDFWQGRCYVSLVGFMFLDTKVKGLGIPFHRDFEEVNLRFYVRRKTEQLDGLGQPQAVWKRGVVFIKEIVPKPAISLVANLVYGEKYTTHQMRHHWVLGANQQVISYEWKPFLERAWYRMSAVTAPSAQPIAPGSEEEFITEHYWGYAKTAAQRTNEYQVEHPRWDVYKVISHEVSGEFGRLYGQEFGKILAGPPVSVFVAEGSEVSVLEKVKLEL